MLNPKDSGAHPSLLRDRRLANQLSQEGLAQRSACSTSLIGLIERGYRPSPQSLQKIAAALGCDPADIDASTGDSRLHEPGFAYGCGPPSGGNQHPHPQTGRDQHDQ